MSYNSYTALAGLRSWFTQLPQTGYQWSERDVCIEILEHRKRQLNWVIWEPLSHYNRGFVLRPWVRTLSTVATLTFDKFYRLRHPSSGYLNLSLTHERNGTLNMLLSLIMRWDLTSFSKPTIMNLLQVWPIEIRWHNSQTCRIIPLFC